MRRRDAWRLDLAQRALRTAEKHLADGRREHFQRSCAFAREMLREYDETTRMTQEQADGAVARGIHLRMGDQAGRTPQRGMGGQG